MFRSSLRVTRFLFLMAWTVHVARGQFYAPDTDYHDRVQRVFPVEAARVVAWWVDPEGTHLTQVTYRLETSADQKSVWNLEWLDGQGKAVKSTTVSYDLNSLKSGPEFYRMVMNQIWAADWTNLPSIKPGAALDAYWRGASKAGVSREEGLKAGLNLKREFGPGSRTDWMPEISGLLAHAALPGLSTPLSIDSVLLARSAAWLALTERSTASNLDGLWSPLLFQAGREHAAVQLWQRAYPNPPAHSTPELDGWNLWLRQPRSIAAYLYACESNHLTVGVPLLAYDALVNQNGIVLADLVGPMMGSPKELRRLHNFGPFLSSHTGVGGGRLLEGLWPVLSRTAWLDLMKSVPPVNNDYVGHLAVLSQVASSMGHAPRLAEGVDTSLAGLREMAPLLRLGQSHGVGPLTSTGVATSRDLLNYGWEMAGLQMSSRYQFVLHTWGVPELAGPILKQTTMDVPGLIPLFQTAREAKTANYRESTERLQWLDGHFPDAEREGDEDRQTALLNKVRLYIKRSWLRAGNIQAQARALRSAKAFGEVTELLDAVQDQGGGLSAVAAVRFLVGVPRKNLAEIPRGEELKFALAESLPQPTELQVEALYDKKIRGLKNFDRAKVLEGMYWQNPDSGIGPRIFGNYAASGAIKSATRFYTQSRGNILDPVSFSNGMGKSAYMLGYAMKDDRIRQWAQVDSECGSYSDFLIQIWDAAAHEDVKRLEKLVEDVVDRYEASKSSDRPGKRLSEFLPLLPALRDPKHPARREAIEFFGRKDDWTILRWIWIQQFKLSAEDAADFLGGRENDLFRLFLIAVLEKDKAKALDLLNRFNGSRSVIDERTVLAACLYYPLHGGAPPLEETDLKPTDAPSIRQSVLGRLKQMGR